jgi:addiction module HigA family antidote
LRAVDITIYFYYNVKHINFQGAVMPKLQSPGGVLQSLLDEYQLNPNKLASEIQVSQSAVRQVIIGKTKISVKFALRLAKYFGNTPKYWLDLQAEYDLDEAAKDAALRDSLKTISKVKKPSPKKESGGALKKGKADALKSAGTEKKAAKPRPKKEA